MDENKAQCEVTINGKTVFVSYADGNVKVHADPQVLQAVIECLERSANYLRGFGKPLSN